MIPQIRRKLWPHVYGNKKLFSKSKASMIINSLYPDKKKPLPVLVKEHGSGIKSTLVRFKHQGLVIQDPDDLYCLTSFGIWFSISNQLGITFLELCALACACCVQERSQSHGKDGFYLLPSFEEIFQKYYSKSWLERVFINLRTNGFGFRVTKKSLRIYPKIHKKLMLQYGEHFHSMEKWLDKIQEKESELVSAALDELF
ncbi:hypothetical protein [Candidatus Nitrosotalea okcheonensis]|uniref:Uncharacterized protein n=1 Tax=Candidatus Nitrosotalea okcheonensis TaxID=1903276 RepID=A0A2H1FEX2_9ARCH|nr:hypothetical protein [Candidatus Nitrosotalea okcheonensis]MDE1832054.1 hypothetical protein [Nitrososphaerota archaeon]SMH71310.1 protein of unknown function [Candidatus Nitrosotalea okcheonensis]